jgi:hypothetical protein
MADSGSDPVFYVPSLRPTRIPTPRISGTAIMGGVHLSTGNYGTAPWWRLSVSGLMICGLLAIAAVLTFVESWLLDHFAHVGLVDGLWGLPSTGTLPWSAYASAIVPVLSFANFLVVLRLSPLSGYHAAEHKVVAAIERYGQVDLDQVVAMPRAHPRCGTVLLLGILPSLLIAYPLLLSSPMVALAVASAGWLLRYRVGYLIQQHFTTKAPTPEQLAAGMEAGRRLMLLWSTDPRRRTTASQALWNRGLPQLLVGVVAGQHVLSFAVQHLHRWLDW